MKFAELVEELDLSAPNKAAMLGLPIEKKWQVNIVMTIDMNIRVRKIIMIREIIRIRKIIMIRKITMIRKIIMIRKITNIIGRSGRREEALQRRAPLA